MEWWYVQCPLHRCSEDMFCSSENSCWAWLQYHLMSSTSGLVPHPRDDLGAMHKAMQDSVVRKLTDTEVQQWSDWQKEKGERSSSKEGAELVEVKEEETESKTNTEFTTSKHPPTPPPSPRAPKRARTEQAAPSPQELYKRIIYQAEVAENAANKMKAVSEAALQLFVEQEKFFKGLKEEMEDELALLELPK